MGKVLGIIAEYNPFHNGHLFHLEESKKQTGSTYTVAIMSGNFAQRGNTSIIDKWSKAEIALYCAQHSAQSALLRRRAVALRPCLDAAARRGVLPRRGRFCLGLLY